MNKPRIVKDYEKLTEEINGLIKLEYPYGFEHKLITFKNKEGKFVSALPFETSEYYYLIRMSRSEALNIILNDDDYDDDGNLTDEARDRLEDDAIDDLMEEDDD